MKKEPVTPLKEQLISFETAKLAKEKGFNFKVLKQYSPNYEGVIDTDHSANCVIGGECALKYPDNDCFGAPTQTLLQKWLREVHNCFIDILPHRDGDSKNKQWKSKKDVFWSVEVDYYGKNFEIELTDDSDFTQHFNKTYEEALEIGLYQALKLIK